MKLNVYTDIRRAFKQSFEDGGVKPVVGTKSPFVYKDNKNKIFVGGISKVGISILKFLEQNIVQIAPSSFRRPL